MDDRSDGKAPVITQEMINLFDDYTHLSLDHRKFLDNPGKFAGSAAAAAGAAALMAANAQAQGLVAENDPNLSVETVSYPGAKGTMSSYLVQPRTAGRFRR